MSGKPEEQSHPKRWNTYWYDSIVTMVFTPPRFGSADLILLGTPRGTLTHITLTYCFEPFKDLVRWMHDVAAGRLPSTARLNEEGSYAVLQALPVDARPDWIELIVDRELDPSAPKYEKRLYWTRVERRQFIREFLRRFQEWRGADYLAEEWHLFGLGTPEFDDRTIACTDPRNLDVTELERWVAG